MADFARFGPPVRNFAPRGGHIAVHLVPVHQGHLVAFDVTARAAAGRWLPWDLLPYGGNPYETAAELGDEWCDGAVTSLALVDALSFLAPGESWELALVFRAELSAMPAGQTDRTPVTLRPDALTQVGRFGAVDLARWLGSVPAADQAPESRTGGLLF
jgi:hypothetical protein